MQYPSIEQYRVTLEAAINALAFYVIQGNDMNALYKKILLISVIPILLLSQAAFFRYEYASFEVEGISMMPSISPKSIQNTKRIHDGDELKNGQVVIVQTENLNNDNVEHPDGVYIKRLVGLPGDTLTFNLKNGSLSKFNGQTIKHQRNKSFGSFSMTSKKEDSKGASFSNFAFDASYDSQNYPVYLTDEKAFASSDSKLNKYIELFFHFPWLEKKENLNDVITFTLGEDEYFVLSDNRVAGTDSRHFGTISRSDISYVVISQGKKDDN